MRGYGYWIAWQPAGPFPRKKAEQELSVQDKKDKSGAAAKEIFMAKTTTRTAPQKDAPAKAGRKASTATIGSVDDLSSLALAGKELEDEQRAQTGSQNSFITLVKANGQVLDKNNPAFMKGVKPLDYVITSKKLKLGAKLDATILGMFKVYAEVKPSPTNAKGQKEEMDKTVAFWMPDQAMQFGIAPGSIFDRELPNGNILQPVHWVYVYLHDFPEVDDGIVAFRSKGNSIYAALQKLVKAESKVCTELRFEISNQDSYNEKYKKTDYYPKFEITGRNYTLTEDGKVVLDKQSGLDRETLKEILSRAKDKQSDYKGMKMVAERNIKAITGPEPRRALPAGKGGYEEDEEDGEEAVSF
jgi:hypothetical protein